MEHLTKQELMLKISEATELTQGDVRQVIQMTLDGIAAALAQGQTVELRNFGVFEVKMRKARFGRNPNDPAKPIPIPARAVVKFKPGKLMGENVGKLAVPPAPSPQ